MYSSRASRQFVSNSWSEYKTSLLAYLRSKEVCKAFSQDSVKTFRNLEAESLVNMAQYNELLPSWRSGVDAVSYNGGGMRLALHNDMQPMTGPSQQASIFDMPISLPEDR